MKNIIDMTPKEKAKELVNRFKKISIEIVDEILKSNPTSPTDYHYNADDSIFFAREYWQEVKQEIEKL